MLFGQTIQQITMTAETESGARQLEQRVPVCQGILGSTTEKARQVQKDCAPERRHKEKVTAPDDDQVRTSRNQDTQQARGSSRQQEASCKKELCIVTDSKQSRYKSRRNSTKEDFGIHNRSKSKVKKRRALSNGNSKDVLG